MAAVSHVKDGAVQDTVSRENETARPVSHRNSARGRPSMLLALGRTACLALLMLAAVGVQRQLDARLCLHRPPHLSAPHAPLAHHTTTPASASAPTDGATRAVGIDDVLHRWTAGLNAWIHNNSDTADVLIIGHALFYDLLTVHYSVVAVALTPTARPIVGLAAIFVLRSLCQASVQLPCPRGFYWKYPGFPSMSIDYEPAADFFFSGHTATLLTVAVEYWVAGFRRLSVLTLAILPLIVLMVITTRTHYTADVAAAVFASGVALIVANAWEARVDPRAEQQRRVSAAYVEAKQGVEPQNRRRANDDRGSSSSSAVATVQLAAPEARATEAAVRRRRQAAGGGPRGAQYY